MNRWLTWHTLIGFLVVVIFTGWIWLVVRIPPSSKGPTPIERKAQHFDELCRMVDVEIKLAPEHVVALDRLATVCHWNETHVEAP